MNIQLNNNLQVFEKDSFTIQTIIIDNKPWFLAREVCDILELSDTNKACSKLDVDEKTTRNLFVSGQNRDVILINESGLYTLIIRSSKPKAKEFRKWVTNEVIPTIRETGGYNLQKYPTTYLDAIKALVVKEEERLELEHKINTSTLFSEKEKAYDKERVYNKDIKKMYPYLNNSINNIMEFFGKYKYKDTSSYVREEVEICVGEFLETCTKEISSKKRSVLIYHECLIGGKLCVKKDLAIKYLNYTEEDFILN